jgi:hypothetical protein
VQVLKECIRRAGSLHEGLKYYVGAALQESDGGYVSRVLLEQTLMRSVADGRTVPVNASNQPPPAPSREAEAATLPNVKPEGQEQVALLR